MQEGRLDDRLDNGRHAIGFAISDDAAVGLDPDYDPVGRAVGALTATASDRDRVQLANTHASFDYPRHGPPPALDSSKTKARPRWWKSLLSPTRLAIPAL